MFVLSYMQVRVPVERFISRFNFHRKNLKKLRKTQELKDATISEIISRSVNECVLFNHTECLYSGVIAKGVNGDEHVASLEDMNLNKIQ